MIEFLETLNIEMSEETRDCSRANAEVLDEALRQIDQSREVQFYVALVACMMLSLPPEIFASGVRTALTALPQVQIQMKGDS